MADARDSHTIKDKSFLILINTHWEAHEFSLPVITGYEWDFVFSTHPMVKSGLRVGREQKELVLPRTICLFILNKQAKSNSDNDKTEKIADNKDNTDINSVSADAVSTEILSDKNNSILNTDQDSIFEKENAINISDIPGESGTEEKSIEDVIDPDYKPDDAIWEQSLDDESESEMSDKKYRGIRPDLEDEEPA